MYDIKLSTDKENEWDIELSSTGDIMLTDSIVQAVKIRLKWIMKEWRLGLDLGFPYFEQVLVKNPNVESIKQRVKKEILKVEGVEDAEIINVVFNKKLREFIIRYYIVVSQEKYFEEANIIV